MGNISVKYQKWSFNAKPTYIESRYNHNTPITLFNLSNICIMTDADFIFDMQIRCFQNFVRIWLKYTTLIFSQIFDNLKKKVGL